MLPSALDSELVAMLSAQTLLVGLDFDGTLAPIVDRPEQAELAEGMRQVIAQLSSRHRVAVISGRAVDDVRARVGLDDLLYGGCHGMQLVGPDLRFEHEEGAAQRPALAAAHGLITTALAELEGAIVEDKGLAIAVHRRNVAEAQHPEVDAAVTAAERPGLRRKRGKMVDELVPDVDWHKGRALLWLRERIGSRLPTLYLGDDVTDEDAFAVLVEADDDRGILVSRASRPTKAKAQLRDPDEVRRFLDALA